MQTIRFGRSNVVVPTISLGTWGHGGLNQNRDGLSVGWGNHDESQAQAALCAAVEAGITHLDTADVYGDGRAEALLGTLLAQVPRDRVFVATKFGWDRGPGEHFYADLAFMRERLHRSLTLLGTDHVDLYYLHHCDFGPEDRYFEGALHLARTFQKEGKVRYVGLSDWNASKIMRFIERVDPDVVQPYRNVVDDDYQTSGLKAYVDTHDLGVAFFSPIKHGLLLGKYLQATEFPPGDFRRNVPGFRDPQVIAQMQQARSLLTERFALRLPPGADPVLHGLLGALLTNNPSATVLLGMRNQAQVQAAALLGEALSTEDLAFVRAAYGSAST